MFKKRVKKDSPEQKKLDKLTAEIERLAACQKELTEFVKVLKDASVVLIESTKILTKKMIKDDADKENEVEKKLPLNDDDRFNNMYG
jgi:3-phosphoglycerate kinase